MIIATTAAMLLFAQQASDAVVAEYPDQPETWTLEYPSLIGGFVEDYYSCLKGGSYEVGDGRGFAEQYRADIPRCARHAGELEQRANERLAERGRTEDATPAEVAHIFENVRRIHLARGADLDRMVGIGLANSRRSRAEAGTKLDAACVARVADLRERRQAYAESEGAKVEALYRQDEYSDQDRLAILTYTNELRRMTTFMQMEMSRCPGSEIAASTAADQVPDG